MKIRRLQYPASKWLKYKVLLSNPEIEPLLPDTEKYSSQALAEFLGKYPVLYLKPSIGGGGKGILKIEKLEDGYRLRTERKKIKFKKRRSLVAYLQKIIPPKKRYLVQQGIDLMQMNERPVDFRVLLTKPKPGKPWKFEGIIGKCAAKNRHVTNRSSGGTSVRLKDALEHGLQYDEEQYLETKASIQDASMKIADTLGRYFFRMNQLGLDIAIDRDGVLWLIEANTRPNYQLFRKHEDPRKFAQIRAVIRKLRRRKKAL